MSPSQPTVGVPLESLPSECRFFGKRILDDWNARNYTNEEIITPPIAESTLNFFPPFEMIDRSDYEYLFKDYDDGEDTQPRVNPQHFGRCLDFLRSKKGFENFPPFKHQYLVMLHLPGLPVAPNPSPTSLDVSISPIEVELAQAELIVEPMIYAAVIADDSDSTPEEEKRTVATELIKAFMALLRASPYPVSLDALKEMDEFLNGQPDVSDDEKTTVLAKAYDDLFRRYPEVEEESERMNKFFQNSPKVSGLKETLTTTLGLALERYWTIYYLWDLGLREELSHDNR